MLYPSFVVPDKYDTDLWKQGSYFMEICDTIMVDDQEKKKKRCFFENHNLNFKNQKHNFQHELVTSFGTG